MDAGGHRREAARRQAAQRLRRPPRAGPGAGRGAARPRRRPAPPAARRRPAGRAGRRAGAGRGAVRRRPDRVRASTGTAPSTRPRRRQRWAGCSTRSPTPAPSRGCTPARPGRRSTCCAAPVRAGSRSTWRCCPPPTTTTLAEALEAGETVVLGVVPSTDPAAPTDRRAGHRVGAALAGHARPGPGRGGRPAGPHPDLRAGRRVARLGAHGARRCCDQRPRTTCPGEDPAGRARVPSPTWRPDRQDRGHHRGRLRRGRRAGRTPRRAARSRRDGPDLLGLRRDRSRPSRATPTRSRRSTSTAVSTTSTSRRSTPSLVPGGTVNADQLPRRDPRPRRSLRKVVAAGKPVAVICHGPWLLVSADLVEGRRLTSLPLARRGRPQRRRAVGRRRGRRRPQPDHQPQPRRPAGVRQGVGGRAGLNRERLLRHIGSSRLSAWVRPRRAHPRGRRWPAPRA